MVVGLAARDANRRVSAVKQALALVALSLIACGGSDKDESAGPSGNASGGRENAGNASEGGGKSGANAAGGKGSAGGGTNGSGANGAAGDGEVTGPSVELGPTYFRFGVNGGYYGPGIDRPESARMSVAAGATSLRTTLPEYYLEKWGDEIETSDYAFYQTLGLGQHACFLIGPTAAHSSAPAGVEEWELAHYAPKNLYEPIFLADDSVNPNNYWTAYVERVAKTYGKYLDIYEVWNEPDQVGGNWQATQAWDDTPPKPSDLIWWNDSIFAYVRMLRITHEVVHRFDDSAAVTTGGIGYGSFLSAILRYTDEPDAGGVTSDFPKPGGQYLDIVSYHYYPVFGGGSSDRGVDGLLEARDDYAKRLANAGEGERKFVVTESGAPRYALGDYPGGEQYSANYLVKAMTLGHYAGLVGIDWFAQGDGAAEGASTDSFQYMGLYFDYSQTTEVADTSRSPQGDAYAWLSTWLPGTAADPQALVALALPSSVRGAAFKNGAGSLLVLWAKTEGDESATATYDLAAAGEITIHSFDPSGGERTESRTPEGGKVSLGLSGMPIAIEVP
jgi:hypothetical protein